ncbi:HupE/UreJ family protein [Aggregatimonas sangjinii]|uniref:HupE/UreJ family protein n=1 Tax=Aggregatimonas sangjinii TaxID=2583587 RepID=A0A5B7SWK6_9FLAO|nr:HupE/UreJ family protein [Aggregatimonas sangjinii]QCX01573.1 HupE/UreJ family protein [Aggregatimonas sangjinii]
MEDFFFYVKLGLQHVLDFSAYDHILFLAALAIPFTFIKWNPVLVLATIFTFTHCLALGLSVYEVLVMDVALVEFLIPVTILLTALFNIIYQRSPDGKKSILLHGIATAFFGLIHGFGFSNYFKMLMAGEEDKLMPLLAFATGIEISQLIIVLGILALAYVLQSVLRVKQPIFVVVGSLVVILLTLPVLIATFPT